MPSIEWQHNRERLLLPVAVMAGFSATNVNESIRTEGLLDTGATGTGIRRDIAKQLNLKPKGQRRVNTVNGIIIATEFIFRIGLIVGNYTDPDFYPDQQQPYMLDREILGFELAVGFSYPLLIGMDVLSTGDLTISRSGSARFTF